jgi:hypothetical protein
MATRRCGSCAGSALALDHVLRELGAFEGPLRQARPPCDHAPEPRARTSAGGRGRNVQAQRRTDRPGDARLLAVDATLWHLEAESRDCEHRADFGPGLIALVCAVYTNNDERAAQGGDQPPGRLGADRAKGLRHRLLPWPRRRHAGEAPRWRRPADEPFQFLLHGVNSYSAACRYLRANSRRASSAQASIGAKLRWAINSGRLNLVMWLETAHSVRYTILRG